MSSNSESENHEDIPSEKVFSSDNIFFTLKNILDWCTIIFDCIFLFHQFLKLYNLHDSISSGKWWVRNSDSESERFDPVFTSSTKNKKAGRKNTFHRKKLWII